MGIDSLRQDVGYALRTVRKNRGYAAVVVATLALGIAANTTIFSILTPYLLRELPYGDPERLVQLAQVDRVRNTDGARFSLPQFHDWRENSRAFEDLAAYSYRTQNLTGDENPEQVMAASISGNMFSVLRARPALGRLLTPADDAPGSEPVVVLSHGIWTRRYGADPGVVGRTLMLDGVAHTVAGVMPPEFNFPWNEVRLWVPIRLDPAAEPRTRTSYLVVGRLRPGWSAEQARTELIGIQRELGALHPEADGQFSGVSVTPLRQALNFAYDIVRVGFLLLLTAVGVVLLIACVNIAILTLARATMRTREVAVRMALGAGRGRLVRQLLAESVVLSVAGGMLGVFLTWLAVRAIGPRMPEALFRVGTATIDSGVLVFSLALTLATPVVFGLVPALSTVRLDLSRALREGSSGAGSGRRGTRGRRALVVVQVSLAVVLITTAILMLRSFVEVRRIEPGFDAERLLVVEVSPPANSYESPEEIAAYFDRATAAVAALPGVRAASTATPLPLNHETWTVQFSRPEAVETPRSEWPVGLDARVAPGYFAAMGIARVAGRDFASADGMQAPPVAIVNRTLAERYGAGESLVGRTITVREGAEAVPLTVVGVVDDVRHTDLTSEPMPQIYRPLSQASTRRRFLVVAAEGEVASPARLTGSVRNALASVDPDLPVTIRPMTEIVMENDFQWRISSLALGAFGAMAVFLTALGLYGVIAFSVARRHRELGIRLALGATGRQVVGLVMSDGMRLTGVGLAIGVLVSLPVSRMLAGQLFGVGPFDPVAHAAVGVLFALVAIAATLRPAVRAAVLAPHEVLREE